MPKCTKLFLFKCIFSLHFGIIVYVERMGKRIGKADHTFWEGTSNEKKTARWTKSSYVKVATRTRQSWKEYDTKEG